MGGFLVRGRGRTVLIDAGLGKGELMGITAGALLDNLRALGVAPEDVTDLVFTHLHIDHVGWATADDEIVFPNATYRCAPAEWDHFLVHHRGAEAARVEPAIDRFERWDGDTTIVPGIDTLATPGHTPGSTTLVLSSGDERVMFLGDLVHCPVQLEDDEWAALFDVDPELAKRTRNALAAELEGTDVRVSGAHFAELTFGRLVRAEGTRRFVV
jgi:glyoxylase-like metal-dependent hydrolase (beta-lactamase superfamily II)